MTNTLIVGFERGKAPAYDDVVRSLRDRAIGDWNALENTFQGITIEPHFKIDTRFVPENDSSGLRTFFKLNVPLAFDENKVASMMREWPEVLHTYRPPRLRPAADDWTDYHDFPKQEHLHEWPRGMNVPSAWGHLGGDGECESIAVLEIGWSDHDDLDWKNIEVVGKNSPTDTDMNHGMMTLGVIAATGNPDGSVGMNPRFAALTLYGLHESNGWVLSDHIREAADQLPPGSVILIEAELYDTKGPVELVPDVFAAIDYAVAQRSQVVIEPAGNGGRDLASFTEETGVANSDYPLLGYKEDSDADSGAVMVGACSSMLPHTRMGNSNAGERVDCYAWGNDVYTVNSIYEGTSAASAIVAGCASSIQGIHQAADHSRLPPKDVRALLKEPTLGNVVEVPMYQASTMPDLEKIIDGGLTLPQIPA